MVTAGVVLQVALLIQSDKLKNDYTYLSWLARVCKSFLVVCLVFLLIVVESSVLFAMSTSSPVSSWSSNGMRVCVCVCVDGMNLKYAARWHIHISVHSVLCQYYTQAHVHTHP